jgi:hypothetical protein
MSWRILTDPRIKTIYCSWCKEITASSSYPWSSKVNLKMPRATGVATGALTSILDVVQDLGGYQPQSPHFFGDDCGEYLTSG